MSFQSSLLLAGNKLVDVNDGSEWSAARAIRVFGVRVGIQTNCAEWLDSLEPYFPPLWQPVSATIVDRIYSLRIGKTSHTLLESEGSTWRTRSLKRLLEEFERRLKMYVAEMARRRVFVHAGAVGWQGKAIVIPGRSFSGKTTLVRELVRAGATYYSDEYAVLDMQGRLHPYPQPLAIRKPGLAEQKKYSAESFGGTVGTKPLPIGLVVVSRFRENARWRPIQLTAGHGVLALLDNTVPARRKPEVVLPTLQKAVSAATILKGDRREAEELAQRLLTQYT